MTNSDLFTVTCYNPYEGRDLLSIWASEAEACAEAKRVSESYASYDSVIIVKQVRAGVPSDWTIEGESIATYQCISWEERRRRERKEEYMARVSDKMSQVAPVSNRLIASRKSELNWAKDFHKLFGGGRKECQARARTLNRAIRQEGKRLAREYVR